MFLCHFELVAQTFNRESTCDVGHLGSTPGLGRITGEGNSYPLQYAGLEVTVHAVAKSRTRLSNFHF